MALTVADDPIVIIHNRKESSENGLAWLSLFSSISHQISHKLVFLYKLRSGSLSRYKMLSVTLNFNLKAVSFLLHNKLVTF